MHFCEITDIASQKQIEWLIDILKANRKKVSRLVDTDNIVKDHVKMLDSWLKLLEVIR